MAFLTENELKRIGFLHCGSHVLISDKCSIYNPQNIHIESNVRIDDYSILSAGEGGIFIGNHVHIACYVSLIGKEKIELADFSGISGRSSIYSSNDDYSGNYLSGPTVPEKYKNITSASVYIGKHVILGVNSCVLPGVSIGDGAVVGAFSLVNRSIPSGIIAAGVPAKSIKARSKVIFQLEMDFIREKKKIE